MKKRISLLLSFFILLTSAFAKSKSHADPVNPKASVEAKNLLNFIYSQANGKKLISGQHEYNFDAMNFIEVPHKISGKYPVIYGCELGMTAGESSERAEQIRLNVVKKAISWWNQGGIVTLCWHESLPGSAVQTFKNTQKRISQEEFDTFITPGTEQNKLLLAEIDQIAIYLKMLQDVHVPILWRPYHEMNGPWFWWGKKNNFKDLWNLLYDRLTNYHHLNNLIWVFGPNCPINPNVAPYDKYYPGSSRVDILGFDAYVNKTSEFKPEWYDDLVKLSDGKPVAMAECGMLPTIEQFKGMYSKLSWYLTWREMLTNKNTDEQIKLLYNDPRTLTREAMPDLKKGRIKKFK
jgi:mannan endo-1,4-beta-mannosidase